MAPRVLGILSDSRSGVAAAGGCTFRRVERHDRFAGGHKPPWKVAPCLARSVIDSGGVGPLADRGTFNPAVPALRLGRPAFSRRLDWRGLFTVLADRGASRSGSCSRAGTQGLWLFGRPPIRPVLKHGPRSLTCARVMGFYET